MSKSPADNSFTIIFDVSSNPAMDALGHLSRVDPNLRRGTVFSKVVKSLAEAKKILEQAKVTQLIDPKLVLLTNQWPCTLRDPQAFQLIADACKEPVPSVVFVTSNSEHAKAGIAFGMRVIFVPQSQESAASGATPGELAAGEIEEDVGPTYVLRGCIVTMNEDLDVIEDGRLVISKGIIRSVLQPTDELPDEFSDAPEIDTTGTIYPGLIDLHNHFAYNVLPLWVVPKKYSNRGQWPSHIQYKELVSMPMKQALTRSLVSAEAIMRFVEAKAIIGGATTGQGINTQMRGGKSISFGGMRNVEHTRDSRLVAARTRVPDVAGGKAIENFRAALAGPGAFFYHLSEGTDNVARKHFINLDEKGLIADTLIGVHSLALQEEDLEKMAANGASIVWSPFSNMLLYGKTIDISLLKDSGVKFAIGCDWAPSGSKNLLQELKVAQFANEEQGSPLTNEELVAAVTSRAAEMVRWGDHLGQLEPGYFADLLVVEGVEPDPYQHLINALEKNVLLVTIHGIARYGRKSLMQELLEPDEFDQAEPFELEDVEQIFFFETPLSPINHVSLEVAIERLNEAMGDLPAWKEKAEQEASELAAFGIDEAVWYLEMDNELDEVDPFAPYESDEFASADLAATPTMPTAIPLEDLYVTGDEYWQRIDQQPNISASLKTHLRVMYGLPVEP